MAAVRLARIAASVASGGTIGATTVEFAARRQQRHPAATPAATTTAPVSPATAAAEGSPAGVPEGARGAIATFEEALAADLAADQTDGSITYAICRGGKVVHTRSFGFADKQDEAAANAGTIYRMGSIGKTFTAVACMRLGEEGVLSLDDAIETHVPEVRRLRGYEEHPPITIRHVRTHTTGLQREPSDDGLLAGPFSEWEANTITALSSTGYDHAPGTKYQYCNISWAVLGVALGRAAAPLLGKAVLVPGGAYPHLLYTWVLEPLGLADSTLLLTPGDPRWGKLATGHQGKDPAQPTAEHAGRGYK